MLQIQRLLGGHLVAHNQVDHQRNQHGGDGGRHHVADMGKQVNAGYGRGQVGGIGQGRYLVTKEGTGDHGPGCPPGRDVEADADTHQCQTHGAHRAPAGAQRDGHNGAQQHGGGQEVFR